VLKILLSFIFIGLSLQSCGLVGTDVGNALTTEVQLLSEDSSPPTALTTALTAATITKAKFWVIRVSIPPMNVCNGVLPPLNTWLRSDIKGQELDWLTTNDVVDFTINTPPGLQACQIRFILAPRLNEPDKGKTFEITGSDGAANFTIVSGLFHPIVIRSGGVPFELSELEGLLTESVLFRQGIIDQLNIEAILGAGNHVISPQSNVPMFNQFMNLLRLRHRGFRFQKDQNNQIFRPRIIKLGSGDQNIQQPEPGEEN